LDARANCAAARSAPLLQRAFQHSMYVSAYSIAFDFLKNVCFAGCLLLFVNLLKGTELKLK
jgi:hypothetical protein